MKDKNDILSNWKKRKQPEVPKGFFDRFADDLMERIETESGFLSQLKKAEKPEVPEGFFDSLPDGFEPDATPFTLDELKKSKQPAVPNGYFEGFADKLMHQLETDAKAKPKGRIILLRIVTTVASAAAAIAIVFSVANFFDHETPQDTITKAPAETEEELYDTYLTYLDEDEIVEYIIENDIELEDSAAAVEYDDYFDYSEEDIEDYYLDELL